jgi:hypothetical protein
MDIYFRTAAGEQASVQERGDIVVPILTMLLIAVPIGIVFAATGMLKPEMFLGVVGAAMGLLVLWWRLPPLLRRPEKTPSRSGTTPQSYSEKLRDHCAGSAMEWDACRYYSVPNQPRERIGSLPPEYTQLLMNKYALFGGTFNLFKSLPP